MSSSHRDYEPFEMAENMEEDLGMFEAATHARHVDLRQPSVESVLVVLDGSNQDATAGLLGQQIASRFSSRVEVRPGLAAADQIRLAAQETGAKLIVLPVPFGEDIDLLKSQSLGSVADSLLQESPAPLLCVREPLSEDAVGALLDHLLLPVTLDDTETERALSWACCLAGKAGRLLLLELPDRKAVEETREGVGATAEISSVQQAAVERAMSARLGALVSAAQRCSTENGFAVRAEFRAGTPLAEIQAMAASLGEPLIVLSRPANSRSPQFHRIVDLLMESRLPLLLL